MLKAKLNGKSYDVLLSNDRLVIDGNPLEWDIVRLSATSFHILNKNKSYSAELIAHDKTTKTITLKINGSIHKVEIKDRYDLLLEKMGLSSAGAGKIISVKAPMPGLILKVNVEAGDKVKAGDGLVVLEAMKMENMIKASADATVAVVKIKKGDSVEKGQILVEFQS